MARARNIKPGFFKNEVLGTSDPFVSLLFAGLWTLADKAGILEDRPLRIRAELFPYRDNFDINGYLTVLSRNGFIHRYKVNGIGYIQVAEFQKHQHPHHTEAASTLPAYSEGCELTVIEPLNNSATPSDSLIPYRLIPDSLNTDSLIPDSLQVPGKVENSQTQPAPKGSGRQKPDDDLQRACRETWNAYREAYIVRYSVEPVRNATVNTQIRNFIKRIGAEESPAVAAFYVQSNSAFYVQRGHSFGNLLADAEKVRTEWATGRSMTATRARQIDQTAANAGVVGEAMKILEGMNNAKNS